MRNDNGIGPSRGILMAIPLAIALWMLLLMMVLP